MNRNLFLPLLLLMLVGPLVVFAQPKLTITSVSSAPSDTAYYPNTTFIRYYAVVENTGNNQLTGPCAIKFRYNSTPGDSITYEWSAVNFEVGETRVIELDDSIRNLGAGRYKGGGNIIVIWPHSDNPNTLAPDTTSHDIYIVDINGVVDPAVLAQRVEVFPNPVQDELSIRYLQRQHKLEYVRIVGMDGRLLWESRNAVEEVDMQTFPSGMYMVVFKYKDGMLGAIRIAKQE